MYLSQTASRAVTLLSKNPPLFCRMLLAKLNTARPLPALPARRRIGSVTFEYDLSRYRGTAPMIFGSYALLVVNTMKKFLRPGHVFLDVGANIGYLSAIAADIVGPSGEVHCFEPVPDYFKRLQRLVEFNPNHAIIANACAAGDVPGLSTIYVTREVGQNTLVPLYQSPRDVIAAMDVPVVRLDSYLAARQIERVALIKIDAEGYELPILAGLEGWLHSSGRRPPIICEIAPRAYPLMGRSLRDLEATMRKYGYTARDLIDGVTAVDITALKHVEDVLFLAKR